MYSYSCLCLVNDPHFVGDVGQVMFPGRKLPWSCLMCELEPARYQPPNYDSYFNLDELEIDHYVFGSYS